MPAKTQPKLLIAYPKRVAAKCHNSARPARLAFSQLPKQHHPTPYIYATSQALPLRLENDSTISIALNPRYTIHNKQQNKTTKTLTLNTNRQIIGTNNEKPQRTDEKRSLKKT